jgi:cyclin B
MNSIINRGRSTNNMLELKPSKPTSKDGKQSRMFGREITNFANDSKPCSSKALDYTTERSHKMLEVNKNKEFYETIAIEAMKRLNSVDKENYGKQYEMAEYAEEIFHYLQKIEVEHIAKQGYMKNQPELNEKMRTVLVDWMIEVHQKFKLLPETLFLAVNLLDRFLEKEKIVKNKLQLVGVAAMLIACKYEEIYAPEVKDFIYITDKSYTKDEIIKMEQKILCKLKFEIAFPSAYRFLERYNKLARGDDNILYTAQYIIELNMLDYKMIKYTPSMQAASALCVAAKGLKRMGWNDMLKAQTGYTELDLSNCIKDMTETVKGVDKMSQQAAKRKFGQTKFKEVSKHKLDL